MGISFKITEKDYVNGLLLSSKKIKNPTMKDAAFFIKTPLFINSICCY